MYVCERYACNACRVISSDHGYTHTASVPGRSLQWSRYTRIRTKPNQKFLHTTRSTPFSLWWNNLTRVYIFWSTIRIQKRLRNVGLIQSPAGVQFASPFVLARYVITKKSYIDSCTFYHVAPAYFYVHTVDRVNRLSLAWLHCRSASFTDTTNV